MWFQNSGWTLEQPYLSVSDVCICMFAKLCTLDPTEYNLLCYWYQGYCNAPSFLSPTRNPKGLATYIHDLFGAQITRIYCCCLWLNSLTRKTLVLLHQPLCFSHKVLYLPRGTCLTSTWNLMWVMACLCQSLAHSLESQDKLCPRAAAFSLS